MLRKISCFNIIFCVTVFGFFIFSKYIFDKIYLADRFVTNENYHLPRGFGYCQLHYQKNATDLTPQIPEYYSITASIMGQLKLCSVYWIRFLNVIASVINLLLFYWFISSCNDNKQSAWMNLLQSVNIALLPPMHLFSNLFYPDILSITLVLHILLFSQQKLHILVPVWGSIAVIIDQNNILWIGLALTNYATCEFLKKWKQKKHAVHIFSLLDIVYAIKKGDLKIKENLNELKLTFWFDICCYLSVFVFHWFTLQFGTSKITNSTEISIHLMQWCYFSLFCIVFSWPYVVKVIPVLVARVLKAKLSFIGSIATFSILVFYNTLQYKDAPNDACYYKYVFYILELFSNRLWWLQYAMVPIYYMGMQYIVYEVQRTAKELYANIFLIFVCIFLAFHSTIEMKNFLLPYIIFRLNVRNVVLYQLILELLFYIALNILIFHIIFSKNLECVLETKHLLGTVTW